MTTELWYLFLSAVVLSCLWIPYIAGVVKHLGPLTPADYVNLRDAGDSPNWVRRANRAHVNMVEQFGAFAGLIIVAHLTGVSTAATAIAAAVFFWARIVHAVIMISGFAKFSARTLSFTVAWLAIMVIAWEIIWNAV
jgi:uncharacterized MAPEG superfamily protein